jgi:hypothetical protein
VATDGSVNQQEPTNRHATKKPWKSRAFYFLKKIKNNMGGGRPRAPHPNLMTQSMSRKKFKKIFIHATLLP